MPSKFSPYWRLMETTQGILLQTIPYLGKKQIAKVLSPDYGLISLMLRLPLSPFCIGEWVFRKGSGDLHTLKDFTLLDPLLDLRSNYATLSAAGRMAQDLLATQFPGKKAPFALAAAYFRKLPQNPDVLAASFRLKLLLHEGLLSEDESLAPELSHLAFCPTFSPLIATPTAPFDTIATLFSDRIR